MLWKVLEEYAAQVKVMHKALAVLLQQVHMRILMCYKPELV